MNMFFLIFFKDLSSCSDNLTCIDNGICRPISPDECKDGNNYRCVNLSDSSLKRDPGNNTCLSLENRQCRKEITY